jgi:hypothetical protein
MNFEKKTKKSEIQSLKLSNKKEWVKLEDVEKNYLKLIKNINISTENSTTQKEPVSKLQTPKKSTKITLKKIDLNNDGVKEMGSNFETVMLTIARDQKNNFKNIKSTEIEDKRNINFKYHQPKVQFPVAQSTEVIESLLTENKFVSVNYLETKNKSEAEQMYKGLVQLYTLTGLDGHQFAKEELKSDLWDRTLLIPLAESSKIYQNLVITINLKTNVAIDKSYMEIGYDYITYVTFETLN